MNIKQYILAGLLTLFPIVTVLSCSGVTEVCLCEAVWYDAFCQHDPNSLGSLDIENSVVDVSCPSDYPSDAGAGVSTGDAVFPEMEKSAKNKIISWTGLTEGQVNPEVKRRSFIQVLGCKKFTIKYGEGHPKVWWKFTPGKSQKDVDPCADGLIVDSVSENVTYPSGCNLVEKDFASYEGPYICEAASKNTCITNATDDKCVVCAKTSCCVQYSVCINDPVCLDVMNCLGSGSTLCGEENSSNAKVLNDCFAPKCLPQCVDGSVSTCKMPGAFCNDFATPSECCSKSCTLSVCN